MSSVAVVGLGNLGMAFALRLHECGFEVQAVERDVATCDQWRRDSGRDATDHIADVTAERIFLCVRTTEQAQSILEDLTGNEAGVPRVVYVVTTLEAAFARGLATFNRADLRVIELPISGGRAGALRGDLTVMVGGGVEQPHDIEFLKSTVAKQAFIFSDFGDATVVKLINNTIGACNAAAFASGLQMAAELGIDPVQCAGVIRTSSGSSWMAESFEVLVDDLVSKDIALLRQEAGRVPLADLSDAATFEAELARARALLAG